ncbi:MAG TPA: hypothetical protein DEB40_10255 [Elusimicrobia bacterium]|nr:hypothetical protein [Elusimicrobiota bacterium]HBT62111.1 hypothetical protein [Elusimicrobiota bacterium]
MKLKFKLAAGAITLAGAGVLAISLFSYFLIQRARDNELKTKGVVLCQQFIHHQADAIQRRDETKLLKGFLDLMNDRDVISGEVVDNDGKVIAHSDINLAGQNHKKILDLALQFPDGIFHDSGEQVLDLISLAKSQNPEAFMLGSPNAMGAVRIGLSKKSNIYFMRNIRHGMIALAAIVIIGAFILSFSFAVLISRPMAALTAAIEEIAGGNLDSRVDIHSSDEIGQVGKAFNKMANELRLTQRQLLQANAELESRLKELAKTNVALEETQDKVVRSERLAAIGQLASGVGHELRNPLAAIRNAVYYIREAVQDTPTAKADPTLMEILGLAENEIKNSNNIISDLLDFSRVVKLAPYPTDVHELLGELQTVLDIPANVVLSKQFAGQLPQATIDPQRMRQVFLNLATNAIQAMPKGGQLSISTRLDPPVNGYPSQIVVAFKDTGEGIRPENMKKLFEPLFTTKAKGTGLGLAISQGFVQAHGGKITVESQPGKGCCFEVHFPLGGDNGG